MSHSGYLCNKCKWKDNKQPRVLASDKPEYVKKKQGRCKAETKQCPMYEECRRRVDNHYTLWVMCEIPTLDDLRIVGVTRDEYLSTLKR